MALLARSMIAITIYCLVSSFWASSRIFSVGNLENAEDILSRTTVSAANVDHGVSFILPINAQSISSTDYVLISLPNFSNVTAPTALEGVYFGTPTFSVSGTTAKVTGIAMEPGNKLDILGITATNPPVSNLFSVNIIVAEDSAGLIIKNIATITASSSSGTIAVSATIVAPVAALTIAGTSAPSTFITFSENGGVLGTDTAGGSNGVFSKYFTGLSPNVTHTITLYGVDSANRTTSPLSLQIYTPIYQNTSVSNLIMPPTIALSTTSVVQGTNIVALGSAIPSGTINLFTESPLRNYTATVTSGGSWNYTITDTANYIAGDYRIYSLVNNGGGSQSINSNSLQFTVLPSTGPTPSPGACSIAQGDLNCDSDINLVDFSLLMYYWGTTHVNADINSDSTVNLTDFSIMMYYWGT